MLLPVLALPAALLLGGCADGSDRSATSNAAGVDRGGGHRGAEPTLAARDLTDPRKEGEAKGPDRPRRGTWYAYDLHVHCGIRSMRFAGAWWRLNRIRADQATPVKDSVKAKGQNYWGGYAQLERRSPAAGQKDVAVFAMGGIPPLEFVRGDRPEPCM